MCFQIALIDWPASLDENNRIRSSQSAPTPGPGADSSRGDDDRFRRLAGCCSTARWWEAGPENRSLWSARPQIGRRRQFFVLWPVCLRAGS